MTYSEEVFISLLVEESYSIKKNNLPKIISEVLKQPLLIIWIIWRKTNSKYSKKYYFGIPAPQKEKNLSILMN